MLIVLLPDFPGIETLEPTRLQWWRTGRDGTLEESGQDPLTQLRSRFPAERLRALAPATAVNLYRVAIPVRRAAAARAALPYALEDQLGQELEELHLVAGPRRGDGRFAAAVTEQRHMQAWLEECQDAGWRLEALLPQASLHDEAAPEVGLHVQPSPWPDDVDQALVTSTDQEPVLIETSMLGFWLKQRVAQLDEEQRVLHLHGFQPADLGLTEGNAELRQTEPLATLEAALKRAQQPARALNLLVGPYTNGMATPPWRKLRPVMIAAGVLLAALVGQLVLEGMALSGERERLRTEIDLLFDRTLPKSRRVDPVTQFQQALAGGDVQAGENGTGSLLYDVLAVVGEGEPGRIRQFRATPTEIELELQLPSFAELEGIRAKLAAGPGLSETLQGADSGTDGVTARLRVQRGGS
ncbi:type II secretion system protein GspL [Halopseudomonas sp. SMJS2]|uniref:type II secretion system protein GspL n=1 Tax=Halopseudomonas sp. SMJS2 TaxID=3041098 RepID=UPI00245363D9|nr:type II secretion system protein GspL [Halopseudomonas sp. SMJS2]WGK60753.1 type II secretion system protein GspL [Halopseudomonas sp. SMJS2]